jgi:hypothetical protein
MKTGNLIWVLIFLVYIVSIIRKKARAASKDGTQASTKNPSGWKAKLEKYLTRIKQEMEASKKEAPGADTVWQELMQSEENSAEPAPQKTTPERRTPVIKKAAVKSTEPAAFVKASPAKGLSYEIQDLRTAVIWSEILAPPLALRE